ncbi:MAG: energy-coupling factor transporter transmembrane component T family protein [Chloroflexota bacterium]
MISPQALPDAQLDSPLGRVSPLAKLAVALGWMIGLAFTLSPWPPIVIGLAALVAGLGLGRIEPRHLFAALAPLWLAALGIGLFNALFGAANNDPTAPALVQLGPFRITAGAALAGVGLGLRVLAIATVGAVFTLTTDSTRLVDSLVQQARMPERFAYGALAAYQAIPRFVEDLANLRQARRIRGLRGSWHPRLLLGLLVLAIRHGDRLAIAMDARGFGTAERSRYREVHWSPADGLLAAGSVGILVLALALR